MSGFELKLIHMGGTLLTEPSPSLLCVCGEGSILFCLSHFVTHTGFQFPVLFLGL